MQPIEIITPKKHAPAKASSASASSSSSAAADRQRAADIEAATKELDSKIKDLNQKQADADAKQQADDDKKARDDKARQEQAEKIQHQADQLQKAWDDEGKTSPRLSLAFALVALGKTEISQFSPLQFLINNLNSAAFNGIAQPFLIELARNPQVRTALYGPLVSGTKDEKIGLSRVLAVSGDSESIAQLQKLSNDTDADVAQAALTAVRNLQARL